MCPGVPDIPDDEYVYHLVVDGHFLASRLIFHGPVRVGDLVPLAEGGGEVTKIYRNGDDGSYQIHVMPVA